MGTFYDEVKKYKREIWFALAAVSLFILIKYVVVYILPFIFAGIFVFLIHKPVNYIHKKTRIGKGFLAGMIMSVFLIVLGIGIWYCSGLGVSKFKQLMVNMTFYEDQLSNFIHSCCDAVENNLGISSLTIENLILERVDIFIDDLKIDVIPKILDQTVTYGKVVFNGIMFVLVTLIAVILLAKDYQWMLEKTEKFHVLRESVRMLKKLICLIGAYIRAQIEIILIVSMICFLGFLLSGYSHPLLWGIVTGLLDVLPFIGTGITLLPMALLQFLMGNGIAALILVITFIVSALARELLEPKLIGARMGVIPIAILFSVYVGAKVFGAAGVIWGPLYMLALYEIYKKLYQVG